MGCILHVLHVCDLRLFFICIHRCLAEVQYKPFERKIDTNLFHYIWWMTNLPHPKPKPTKSLRISDHIPSTLKKKKYSWTISFAYTKCSTQRLERCERQKNYQRWLHISNFSSLDNVDLSKTLFLSYFWNTVQRWPLPEKPCVAVAFDNE